MKLFYTCLTLFFCSRIHAEEISILRIKSDTTLSLAVFTPGGMLSDLKTKPAFFFFEPWGNGSYPVDLYRSLANKYDIVLIGANFSRNGMPFDESSAKFNTALTELTNEYGLNPKTLCLVGFSGGGKVALYTSSMQSSIPYVIYGGATVDAYLSGKDVLGFAGTKDMNYTDLLDYDNSLNIKVNVRHFIIEYGGWHSWFDSATMENAFIWLKLELMKNKMAETNPALIQAIAQYYQREADSLNTAQLWLQADNTIRKAQHFLKGLTSTPWFDDQQLTLEKSFNFKKEKKLDEYILQQERQIKNNYAKYFFTQDTIWWKGEIGRLRSGGNDFQSASNNRLIGFIGLSCYYSANDAFDQNDLITAEKILDTYRIAFPQSAEQAFLRAVYWAKKNDLTKSDAAFSEAKSLGFKEWDKDNGETILQYFKRRPLK